MNLVPFPAATGTGIILLSGPSPHWWVFHLGFSFRLGLWYHRYSFPCTAGFSAGLLVLIVIVCHESKVLSLIERNHGLWLA